MTTKKTKGGAPSTKDGATLPSEKTKPKRSIHEHTWLIYGRKKIGKSSLLAHFPKCLFFPFEPGLRSLSIYKVPERGDVLEDWDQVLKYIKLLENGKHDFQTVCFDPGDKAYKRSLEYTCDELEIEHPGKVKDYGASWDAVASEFQSVHERIAAAGLAFVVLAHEKTKDFEDYDGKTYERVVPKFGSATEDYYEGTVDIIGYYHYVGRYRALQIRGDQFVAAGCRAEGAFLTPSGEQIVKVPMGFSSKESYDNLTRAYNNEQEETFEDDDDLVEWYRERKQRKGGSKTKSKSKKRVKSKAK